MSTKEQERKLKLWGQTLREVGILFFVFGPVDAVLSAAKITTNELYLGIVFMVAGAIMALIGLEMESKYGL